MHTLAGPAVKLIENHNGKAFSSEDAKWSYDTLSTAAESAWKNDFNWIEKTEAPDPSRALPMAPTSGTIP